MKTTKVLALPKGNEGRLERHKSIKSSQPWERSPFLTKRRLGQFLLGFFPIKEMKKQKKRATKPNLSDSIDRTEPATYLK